VLAPPAAGATSAAAALEALEDADIFCTTAGFVLYFVCEILECHRSFKGLKRGGKERDSRALRMCETESGARPGDANSEGPLSRVSGSSESSAFLASKRRVRAWRRRGQRTSRGVREVREGGELLLSLITRAFHAMTLRMRNHTRALKLSHLRCAAFYERCSRRARAPTSNAEMQ
jgi:hypothetical protein